MKFRPAAISVAVLAAALSLSACQTQSKSGAGAGASGGSGGGSNKVTIMVGGASKVIYMPAKLTEQLGYFKDQGLDVTLVDTPAGVTAETALLANQAQGVVGFYDHTIDMQSKGKCLESVVQFANVPGEVEMVSKKSADTVKAAADFKGKKLGVTSPVRPQTSSPSTSRATAGSPPPRTRPSRRVRMRPSSPRSTPAASMPA